MAEGQYKDPNIKSITFENLRKKNQYIQILLSSIKSAEVIGSGVEDNNMEHENEADDILIEDRRVIEAIIPFFGW